jgi:hypothetical protein
MPWRADLGGLGLPGNIRDGEAAAVKSSRELFKE